MTKARFPRVFTAIAICISSALTTPVFAQTVADRNAPAMQNAGPSGPEQFGPLAAEGNSDAFYMMGDIYLGEGEVPKALAAFRAAAERGHALAAYRLGSLYYEGEVVPADDLTALQWFRTSYKAGDPDALNFVAAFFWEGRGVAQDQEFAVQLMLRAASEGSTCAARNLAMIYAVGDGVPQDEEEALKWARVAGMIAD